MGETVYVFEHKHGETVMPEKRIKVTPLVLFAVFFMGPSEPLIPLLFFSGTQRSIIEITVLVIVFAISTIVTMLLMVARLADMDMILLKRKRWNVIPMHSVD